MVHKNNNNKKPHSIRSKIQFSYGAFLQINQKEVRMLKDVKVYQFKVHVLKKGYRKGNKIECLL